MCEEESEDSEAVAKLLDINDSIHRTVERYKLIKKGDDEAASKIPQGTLGTRTGVGKNAANELSLIDFEPEAGAMDSAAETRSGSKAATVEDDLLGLSIDDSSSGQGGGIALGFGANSGVPGPPLLSSALQQNSAAPSVPTSSPPQAAKPNYERLSTLAGTWTSSQTASPSLTQLQQQQRRQQQQKPSTVSSGPTDPFAALIAPTSRSSSPFSQPATVKPNPNSSSVDFPTAVRFPATTSSQNGVATDDEWNFASSLPEGSLPASHRLEVHSSSIKIEFLAARPVGEQLIRIIAQFSNKTDQVIQGLHFQVAVEKVMVKLFPVPLLASPLLSCPVLHFSFLVGYG